MIISDSHAHYTDDRFSEEYPGGARSLLRDLFQDDVGLIVNMSVCTSDIPTVVELVSAFPYMYAGAGIHPTELGREISLNDAIGKLRYWLDNRKNNKIVCIGEIGLDYHYDNIDKSLQQSFFKAQIELACEYSLPVSVHDREAHEDVWEMIKGYPDLKGVMHCFSGSAEMAERLLSLGWYIGIGGVVTFKNSRRIKEVVSKIPLNRILLETDCPYLSPEPFRGKINRSDYISYVVDSISDIKGIDPEIVASSAFDNALHLFKIEK